MSTTAAALDAGQFIAEHLEEIRRLVIDEVNQPADNVAHFSLGRDDLEELDRNLFELERLIPFYRAIRLTDPEDWSPEVVRYAVTILHREYVEKLSCNQPTLDEAEEWVRVARRAEALQESSLRTR